MDTMKNDLDEECSDDDIFLSPTKKSKSRFENAIYDAAPVEGIYEETVKRIKACIVGIPRPPVEVSNVDFRMEDIVSFINSSNSIVAVGELSAKLKSDNVEGQKNKLGVFLNLDHSCEELERIGALYVEKYLPFETMSTMSDYNSYKNLTASAKKRRRCNGWASSPGSRLSYLARRKSTFSVDQVSKIGHPANSKQIILQRDQMKKGTKSVPLKPKRALFQSPEQERKHNPYRTPDTDKKKRTMRRLSMRSPNAVRVTPQQTNNEIRKPRSCRKSLEFVGDAERRESNNGKEETSDKRVKRKLLWAVSTALKSVSVTSSHGKFKVCMNKLFKASLGLWNERCQSKNSQQENSTSEAMLILAKSLLNDLIVPELVPTKQCEGKPGSLISHLDNKEVVRSDVSSNERCPGVIEPTDIPVRTLTELTNSDNNPMSPNKERKDTEYGVICSPVREIETNKVHPKGSSELSCFISQKRKRKELEDEEELMGFKSLDCYPVSKSAKTESHYRMSKLTSSGT